MAPTDPRAAVRAMVAAREWEQFHSPANLAKSIAIEAGELLEAYQWVEDADPAAVADELADVLTYCYLLADRLELDVDQIVLAKVARTEIKYPIDKARGRSLRYDQLPN